MATADLGSELLAKKRQFLALWSSNVRRETPSGPTHGSEENQLWKFGGGKPGEPAAIVNPTKCQSSVAVKTVPTKLGCFESFAVHGLHRVPEESL